MSDGIPCMWMRGGTSKGAYFLASDLPEDKAQRDALLLNIMGSPDPRQIDGIGGGDPLTSKVAIVSPSQRSDADIEYLFLQVFVDRAVVSDAQNCGNILAGVGPFAIERGLVTPGQEQTTVSVFMQNTGKLATQVVNTPEGRVTYTGESKIDGVPGTASEILVSFQDIAGSTCGSLLPTGNNVDIIDDIPVTCIDNGMPVVILKAEDLDVTGTETREELDRNQALKNRLESIRLQAGRMMNLGDVTHKTVPKMSLVSQATEGTISTRTFIPHRCHASIGVLGAVSVATACLVPDSPAHQLARIAPKPTQILSVEHPIGEMSVVIELNTETAAFEVQSAAIVRTARKLFDGLVF